MKDVLGRLSHFLSSHRLDGAGTDPRLIVPLEFPAAPKDCLGLTLFWLVDLPSDIGDGRVGIMEA